MEKKAKAEAKRARKAMRKQEGSGAQFTELPSETSNDSDEIDEVPDSNQATESSDSSARLPTIDR